MGDKLTIPRASLDGYPFVDGAMALELLHRFKKRFPNEAGFDKIQAAILRVDAVYCQSCKTAHFLDAMLSDLEKWREKIREVLDEGGYLEETGTEEVQEAYKSIVSIQAELLKAKRHQAKLLEYVDWQAVTTARDSLAQIAVELAESGVVELV